MDRIYAAQFPTQTKYMTMPKHNGGIVSGRAPSAAEALSQEVEPGGDGRQPRYPIFCIVAGCLEATGRH
jgi:hypothetical protein